MILWYFGTSTHFHGYLEGVSMWAIVCVFIEAHDNVCILHLLSRTSMLKPAFNSRQRKRYHSQQLPLHLGTKNKTIQFLAVNSTMENMELKHESKKGWLYQPFFPCVSIRFHLAPLSLVISQWKLLRLELACNTGMGRYSELQHSFRLIFEPTWATGLKKPLLGRVTTCQLETSVDIHTKWAKPMQTHEIPRMHVGANYLVHQQN